ncbi:hypothetical protein MHAE_10086 [Mycobacterium haemophilum DSM 44634]|uniref:PE family protein n=1 Tax=Mycobacterium haemophilum TaxID=29311 RepID=UPI000656648D|nr:PE family protein [Mycobacterium haemophilum]AKN17205.1 hypothetical protein B586_12575 [Mycobacterium haemophilum DSM 44634]MCV7339639.1 PE family protein [Mycobacterium haemophilum DSM 44634]
MSYTTAVPARLTVNPDQLNDAAVALTAIIIDMRNFCAAAFPEINGVKPPGMDLMSANAAWVLGMYASRFDEKFFKATKMLERWVVELKRAAAAYSSTEADNTKALQQTDATSI